MARRQSGKRKSSSSGEFFRLLVSCAAVAAAFVAFLYFSSPDGMKFYRKNVPPDVRNLLEKMADFRQSDIPDGKSYFYGIDVSQYQKKIDWDALHIVVAPDKTLPVSFVIAKATEGTTITDKFYRRNREEAEKRHIPNGAYHFFSLHSPAEKQAAHFIETVTLKPGDVRPVLDFEVTSVFHSHAALRKRALTWLGIVEKHYGCRPIIYTCPSVFRNIFNSPEFDDYDFWMASYDYDPKENYIAWQFSQSGTVSGIRHKTDLNVVKSRKDFDRLFFRK